MRLYPREIKEYLAAAEIPRSLNSKIFMVDPASGNDANAGDRFTQPFKTLAAAYAACTADRHDTVLFLSRAAGDTLTASLDWAKSYTHLIGLSSPLPGVGQRARVLGGAATDISPVVTFSGNGCIVKNIQFYNGKDHNSDSGCVDVTGYRNAFLNCFFAGMAHATPAARAGSYSLKVSGEENYFERCAVGLDTVVRAQDNAELVLAAGAARNVFRGCRFLSYSERATKVLVSVADGVDRWQEFEDCLFQNFSVNWAATLANAFKISAAATHQIILRGQNNQLAGVDGWADVVTHVYAMQAAPGAGFGVNTAPTT